VGLRGCVYRYIRSSAMLSALYQYHTPIIHSHTPICIYQVAHVHEIHPHPEQSFSYLSLVWYSVSPRHPVWLRKWCARRQRGIHCVLNYRPRIHRLPVHHFKIEPPHHFALLSEDTPQPIVALSASDRSVLGRSLATIGSPTPIPIRTFFVCLGFLSFLLPEQFPNHAANHSKDQRWMYAFLMPHLITRP